MNEIGNIGADDRGLMVGLVTLGRTGVASLRSQ